MQLSRPLLLGLGAALLGAAALWLRPKTYKRILLVGDSQLDGSYTLGGRLAELLRKRGFTVQLLARYGKGAATGGSYFLAERLPSALKSFKPDLVVVSLGGNDASRHHPSSKRAAYQKIIRAWAKLIQASGADLIWFTPSTADNRAYEAKRQKIREHLRSALEPMGVTVYDHSDLTRDIPRRKLSSTGAADGVHFNRPEYERWAKRVNEGPLASLRLG
ncbi:hypothetical protein CMI47_17860 [Candidatus Pacearchaeota archaeon]|nr:hypothetical protein [Candidatus Pacearchaeota archaeon]|tara:strand:+ start:7680 stop:8333 length:654 start_codon:yes stop_codon:yes gene_type:complete